MRDKKRGGPGKVKQGKARKAKQSKTRQVKVNQVKGKVGWRRDETEQGKARKS